MTLPSSSYAGEILAVSLQLSKPFHLVFLTFSLDS